MGIFYDNENVPYLKGIGAYPGGYLSKKSLSWTRKGNAC